LRENTDFEPLMTFLRPTVLPVEVSKDINIDRTIEAEDVLPNTNRTQATERAENTVFYPW